ncbi:hypothetical protein BK132_15435 [Paenibacillus sp. FSL H8-0259]|nr:hypothetical protein BK132_15435 [Paenibacillus sp. FSL H8-0259]
MYAENRIQCAANGVDEPNVCEKPSTMCHEWSKQTECMRKTEYNMPSIAGEADHPGNVGGEEADTFSGAKVLS